MHFSDAPLELLPYFEKYTVLDSNFPRPILTFLGMNYQSNKIESLEHSVLSLIFVPQLIRDVLAIHDDIIDEDLIKFNSDTIPFSYSKLEDENTPDMTKRGKDLSILFGDYLLPKIYDIVCDLDASSELKIDLLREINDVFKSTNIGQIDEILMEKSELSSFSSAEIIELYKRKAANYCYAFPCSLGLICAHAPQEVIDTLSDILLRIGACSQIVNDVEGVFFESFSNERNTLSDLKFLRRTYLLVKFSKKNIDPKIAALLKQKTLSDEEALCIKEQMIREGILLEVLNDVENDMAQVKERLAVLSIGNVLKEYMFDLIDIRVLSNLKKMSGV